MSIKPDAVTHVKFFNFHRERILLSFVLILYKKNAYSSSLMRLNGKIKFIMFLFVPVKYKVGRYLFKFKKSYSVRKENVINPINPMLYSLIARQWFGP